MEIKIKSLEPISNTTLQAVFEYKDIEKVRKMAKLCGNKKISANLSIKYKARSLDANAFLWKVLGDMANKLNTDKDSLYFIMLERYGVFSHYIVHPKAITKIKQTFKLVRVLGEVTVNGKTGIQVQVYYGSSTYNRKEFSVLLDGVLGEAKEIGLEYITEQEKNNMLNEWGNKEEK